MIGDQDVLNALIGAKEFEWVMVRFLLEGKEVIHSGGALAYSTYQRLSGLGQPVPPFIHSQAGKPWIIFSKEYLARHGAWVTFYRRLLQETSPYIAEARRLRQELGDPAPWLDVHSIPGVILRAAGFGHFALRGLPLTFFATAMVSARKWFVGMNDSHDVQS
jgi:hypothetical protein